ncbi:MAG TPA: metallophosphoesterase [Vicinamibacterales bacterium]
MQFGAVGDLHGDFDVLDRIMARHPEVAFWVCPGDLAADDGEYPQPRAPLYWIKGNNEDFDFVAAQSAGSGTVPNLHYIPNGVSVQTHGLSLAGLGGTFAPTWYEKPVSELRRLSPRDDRRRHFVHAEVDACKALQGVDIFISHEAARPFPLPRVKDAGKTPINEALAGMHPRLHLFGHHHLYTVAERQEVPSIGLDKVSESYLLFDGNTLAHQRLTI